MSGCTSAALDGLTLAVLAILAISNLFSPALLSRALCSSTRRISRPSAADRSRPHASVAVVSMGLLPRALQESFSDVAPQRCATTPGFSLPRDLVAVHGHAKATLLHISGIPPGDTDVAVAIEVPAATVVRTCRLPVGRG